MVTSGLMMAPWPIQQSGPSRVRRAWRAAKKAARAFTLLDDEVELREGLVGVAQGGGDGDFLDGQA